MEGYNNNNGSKTSFNKQTNHEKQNNQNKKNKQKNTENEKVNNYSRKNKSKGYRKAKFNRNQFTDRQKNKKSYNKKVQDNETMINIKDDIKSLEKEIEIEIKSIRSMKL